MIDLPFKPMLAKLTVADARILTRPGMAWEPKWDGYRLLADVRQNRPPRLWSRSGNVQWWYPIAEQLSDTVDAILDGELIWMEEGRPSFNGLQNYASKSNEARRSCLRYEVFDVLMADGVEVWRQPYFVRRQKLDDVIARIEAPNIEASLSTADGVGLWEAMELAQMEGVIGKPLASEYRFGERGTWMKIKRKRRATFLVIGYTFGEGGREGEIGALILADETMRYRGKVGTGFDGGSLMRVKMALDAVRTENNISALSPQENIRARRIIGSEPVVWVSPVFRASVEFSDLGADGTPRFPSLKGFRRRGE